MSIWLVDQLAVVETYVKSDGWGKYGFLRENLLCEKGKVNGSIPKKWGDIFPILPGFTHMPVRLTFSPCGCVYMLTLCHIQPISNIRFITKMLITTSCSGHTIILQTFKWDEIFCILHQVHKVTWNFLVKTWVSAACIIQMILQQPKKFWCHLIPNHSNKCRHLRIYQEDLVSLKGHSYRCKFMHVLY